MLSDVKAEDKFALPTLKPDLMGLFQRCIKGARGGFAAGYVLVGPKRMIALTLKPTPSGFNGGQGEGRDSGGNPREADKIDRGAISTDFQEGKAE